MSNSLHEALILKDPIKFWKTFNNKFGVKTKNELIVEDVCDETDIANNFASRFSATSSNSNQSIVTDTELVRRLSNYVGSCDSVALIDVVLVDNVITELQHGKAAGLDTLTAEHL